MLMDDREVRRMTAMWADTGLNQLARFEEAMDTYAAAQADYEFRATFHKRGDPQEWAREYETANQYLTQHQAWNVGAERYFLLVALAQLRKCLLKLPSDGVPRLREDKMLRLLRDIDEHWEQGDETRSLTELREWKPELEPGPGRVWFNNKHVWIGDASLSEVHEWLQDVGRLVRERAEVVGSPIPKPEDQLLDGDVG